MFTSAKIGIVCVNCIQYSLLFELTFFIGIRDALKYLTEALQSINEVELDDVIENVIDAVEKQPCK